MSFRSLLKSYSSSQTVINLESLDVENRKTTSRVSFSGNSIDYYSIYKEMNDCEPSDYEKDSQIRSEDSYINHTPSDMDCSFPSKSPLNPSSTRNISRTALQLISEFEQFTPRNKLQPKEYKSSPLSQSQPSPIITSKDYQKLNHELEEKPTTHSRYFSKEMSPRSMYLTPVKEEPESINSSGANEIINYHSSCPIPLPISLRRNNFEIISGQNLEHEYEKFSTLNSCFNLIE